MVIVFIVSRIPYPLEKGDKLRAYHQLKNLSVKHTVHLICLNDTTYNEEAVKHLEQICSSVTVYNLKRYKIAWRLFLALFSKKPYQVHYFYDTFVSKKIRAKINSLKPNHIYCQLIRTSEYMKNLYGYPKTIDYMDAFSKGMYRRAEDEKTWFKPFVKAEAKRLTSYENIIFDYFDNKTIISEQDRDLIYHKQRKSIYIITNGIDEALLNNTTTTTTRYDILFHGNLSYQPNTNCVKYIVKDVLPELLKQTPNIRIAISGASPSQKVIDLCKTYPNNITLLGYVDSIVETYKSATLFFAPLQIGTGLQNKLLEAMALKIPCITSELCNNALKAKPGDEILIGKTVDEYVDHILALLQNKTLCNQLAQNGHAFVKENFSWQKSTNELIHIFENTKAV